MESSYGISQVATAVSDCQNAFERCVHAGPEQYQSWARERLVDFNMWADGLGVSADAGDLLQVQLQEFEEGGKMLVNLVSTLAELLERITLPNKTDIDPVNTLSTSSMSSTSICDGDDSGIEGLPVAVWSDASEHHHSPSSSSVGEDAGSKLAEDQEDFMEIFQQLLHLSAVITRSETASRLLKADLTFSPSGSVPLQALQAHCEYLLRINIWRKQRSEAETSLGTSTQAMLDEISEIELEKGHRNLINFNLLRRHRFLFAQARTGNGSERHIERAVSLEPTAIDHPVVEESLRHPLIQNTTAVDPNSVDNAVPELKRSLSLNTLIHVQRDMINNSVHTSTFTGSAAKIQYPRPPAVCKDQQTEAFKCPCCHYRLPAPLGRQGDCSKWRSHLRIDLMPYHCPLPSCQGMQTLYASTGLWLSHLSENHEMTTTYQCPACDENIEYTTRAHFESHVSEKHKDTIPEEYLETLTTMTAQKSLVGLVDCPVCAKEASNGTSCSFLEHVVVCLHEFALRSLPWNDSSPYCHRGPARFDPEVERYTQLLSWIASLDPPPPLGCDLEPHLAQPELQLDHDGDHLPADLYFDQEEADSLLAAASSRGSMDSSLLHESLEVALSASASTRTEDKQFTAPFSWMQPLSLDTTVHDYAVTQQETPPATDSRLGKRRQGCIADRNEADVDHEEDEDRARPSKAGRNNLQEDATSLRVREQIPCILAPTCAGTHQYMSDLLRKLDAHASKHDPHARFVCGNCYEVFETSSERSAHSSQGCVKHCVSPDCSINKHLHSANDAFSVLALRHRKESQCPPNKGRSRERWRYVYALCRPTDNNIPDPVITLGVDHVGCTLQSTTKRGRIREPAQARTINQRLAECERLLTDAQTENMMLKLEKSRLDSEKGLMEMKNSQLRNLLRMCLDTGGSAINATVRSFIQQQCPELDTGDRSRPTQHPGHQPTLPITPKSSLSTLARPGQSHLLDQSIIAQQPPREHQSNQLVMAPVMYSQPSGNDFATPGYLRGGDITTQGDAAAFNDFISGDANLPYWFP